MTETISQKARRLCGATPNCPRRTWKVDPFRERIVPGRCYLEGRLTDALGHGGGFEGVAKEEARLSELTPEQREEACQKSSTRPASKGRSARKRAMPEEGD